MPAAGRSHVPSAVFLVGTLSKRVVQSLSSVSSHNINYLLLSFLPILLFFFCVEFANTCCSITLNRRCSASYTYSPTYIYTYESVPFCVLRPCQRRVTGEGSLFFCSFYDRIWHVNENKETQRISRRWSAVHVSNRVSSVRRCPRQRSLASKALRRSMVINTCTTTTGRQRRIRSAERERSISL